MSQFLFEGHFKRTPVQSLGGRSQHAQGREAVLWKAQLERERRQNERARLQAVAVLQATFRGMVTRKKVNSDLRHEFQRKMTMPGSHGGGGGVTVDILEHQMRRLNHFFNPKTDAHLLCDLAKGMILRRTELMSKMLQDSGSMFRVLWVLEKALIVLGDGGIPQQSRSTILRLLEAFTDWRQVGNTEKKDEVVVNLWIHLAVHRNFFWRYTQFLKNRLPVKDADDAKRILQHFDYTIFYQRFLETVGHLNSKSDDQYSFTVNKTVKVTPKQLVKLLLVKLAESLTQEEVLRDSKEVGTGTGVVEFLLLPCVAKLLAVDQDEGRRSLWSDHWLEVIMELVGGTGDEVTMTREHAGKLRQILYGFLVMVKSAKLTIGRDPETVLRVVNCLLSGIDNRKLMYEQALKEIEDLEEDVEMKSVEEVEATLTFFKERQKIYQKLQTVLNNLELQTWLSSYSNEKWSLVCGVISQVIEMEPIRASLDFLFLTGLCNNSDFMNGLCADLMGKTIKDKEELVVVCWMVGQLMNILHDGEFLSEMPFTSEQLLKFIKLLEEVYTEIVLTDKDVTSSVENWCKKEIAKMLMSIHDRNTRIGLFPEETFIFAKFTMLFPMTNHSIKFEHFGGIGNGNGGGLNLLDGRLFRVLNDFPFSISFHDRVSIWHQLLSQDRLERHVGDNPMARQNVQIRRNFIYEDAFEKLSVENVPDLRADLRISLVSTVGLQEAGVDGGGLLREFLTEATKAGVDPNRGLFRVDTHNRLYPNPIAKRIFKDYWKHFYLMGRLVGKALYCQILLELPLAAFFMQLATFGSISCGSAVDYLATLDPDLHRNLLMLKSYQGDWGELGLDFTVALDELGEQKVVELKLGGGNIAVERGNVIEYIHLVADYKINKEIMEECRWFRTGLLDVVPVLRIFSWKEMQTLISGSDKPINVQDWKENTNYAGGYSETHATIRMFWQVVEHFDEAHLRKLLKYVTSCSRPPLLGFKDLVPKFGISNAGVTDRLPTAATCMNLLKLPEFADIETLRERLVYAISAQAGFELS